MKKFSRPHLESLEGRLAPATVSLVGSTLFVSNQSGPLVVEAKPAGIHVQDSVTNVTVASWAGAPTISVTDTVVSDQITVRGVTVPLRGNLVVNAGRTAFGPGESDVVRFEGTQIGNQTYNGNYGRLMALMEVVPAKVIGNVTYNGGTGDNFFSIQAGVISIYGDVTVNANASAQGTNLTIGDSNGTPSPLTVMGKVTYNGGNGPDQVFFNNVKLRKVCVDLGLGGFNNVFFDSPTVTYHSLFVTGGPGSVIVILGSII